MAATRFSDSATPTFDFSKSRPKVHYYFRFDHDDFLHAFFELRSISRHFGPFWTLLKVLPVSEVYFQATDLDLVHQVF